MTREQDPDKGKEEQMGNNPSDAGTNRQQQQNQGGKQQQQQGTSGTQPVSSSVNSEQGHARVTPGGGQGAQHNQSARGAGQFGDDQGGAEMAQSLMEQSRAGAQGDRHQGDDRGLPGQQQQSSQQGASQSQQAQQSQQQQQQPPQQGSSQSGQSSQQPQQQNLQEAVRQAQQQKSAQQAGGGASQQHQQAAGGTLQPGSKGPQNPAVSGSHQTLQPHSSGHDQPGKSAGRTNSNDDSANGPHRGG